jgi:hypothetical protein
MRCHLSLGEVLDDLVRQLRHLTVAELAFAVVPELGRDRFVSSPDFIPTTDHPVMTNCYTTRSFAQLGGF